MKNSFYNVQNYYLQKSVQDVVDEYSKSVVAFSNDYEKCKWGSRQGMMNRFGLALGMIEWQSVANWLDIGCGPGNFFQVYDEVAERMISRVGIDITPGMIQAAQRKTYSMNTQFVLSDFEDYLSDGSAEFDLITMIGVLQQCNVEPGRAFSLCSENLRDGGQLFITTKNIKWNAFKKDGFIPEKGHAWFDPDNLVTSLKEAGFREIHCDGFLPRENRIVECNASHTVFFHCRR